MWKPSRAGILDLLSRNSKTLKRLITKTALSPQLPPECSPWVLVRPGFEPANFCTLVRNSTYSANQSAVTPNYLPITATSLQRQLTSVPWWPLQRGSSVAVLLIKLREAYRLRLKETLWIFNLLNYWSSMFLHQITLCLAGHLSGFFFVSHIFLIRSSISLQM